MSIENAPPPEELDYHPYGAPAGGWGSAQSLGRSLLSGHVPVSGTRALLRQNKPQGFACVSCAWAKPADPHVFEFCENGAKATTWEMTAKRVTPEFFASHTVAELATWDDHHLEAAGRLTHPMRWDAASDKYLPVSWDDAFREIGHELRAIDPASAVFYASGRGSLETSFMYALFARMFQNLLKGGAASPQGHSIRGVIAERDRAAFETAFAEAVRGQSDVRPIDAATNAEAPPSGINPT